MADLTKRQSNPVVQLKSYFSNEHMKKRFEEMLGKRAGAFTNSVVNLFRNSDKLQKCTPDSMVTSALRAATFNLPIDPALGQAAIVPYGNSASFQIMYKGLVQLCIRSGQYATIHCSEVYEDELKSHNPITGEVEFNNADTYKMRYAKDRDKHVVGHYAYFKLLTGFEKSDYMRNDEAMAHGAKYSAAYKYDLSKKKKASLWSTEPIVMCNKTVLIRLLTHYGVMSIEMQDALIGERESFEDAQEIAEEIIEDEAGSQELDEKPEPEATQEIQEEIEDDFMGVNTD